MGALHRSFWVVVLAALSGCADLGVQPTANEPKPSTSAVDRRLADAVSRAMPTAAAFKIAVPIPKRAVANVATVGYVVSGADMVDVTGQLTINANDVASGVVKGVKAGTGRKVTLNARNSAGTLTYSGSSTVDIISGQTASVSITLRPVSAAVGDLGIEGSFEPADGGSGGDTALARAQALLGYWQFTFGDGTTTYTFKYQLDDVTEQTLDGEYFVSGRCANNDGSVQAVYVPESQTYVLINVHDTYRLGFGFTLIGDAASGIVLLGSYENGDWVDLDPVPLQAPSGRAAGF